MNNPKIVMILLLVCLSFTSPTELPKVLLIGDSISIGYLPFVQEQMKGKVIVDRIPLKPNGKHENCQGTTNGIANIDRWLGDTKWDLIHFNFGLHDIKHVNPKTGKSSNEANDPHQADLKQYKKNLKEIVTQLQATGAQLVFATTTPYPEGTKPYRGFHDEVKYNQVARKIMKKQGIPINDLHAYVLPRMEKLQRPANVHFTAEGSKQLAEQVAAHIMKHLPISTSTAPSSTVHFPTVSEPIQLTQAGKEHFFASYYGINSFSKNQRYVTVLQTDIKHKLPTEQEPATLGLVDLTNHEFIPIATTRAWNFQQGCMAHWLGTNPDSLIIYNDLRDDRFVSVILNVHTQQELKVIPHPVSAVSPDGKEAVSINFARLRKTRKGYGYGGNGQAGQLTQTFPEEDGLFLVDLETGEANLLVSVADVKALVPEVPADGLEYFNHTLFSREGSRIFWLARARPERNTTAFTVNRDGSDLKACFPIGWGGSHFDWLNDDELMITAEYEAKQWSHILFHVDKSDYKRLGKGLLDYDGHGTFSPDGNWMVTDTYPKNGLREQKIYLMDMNTHAVLPLGAFPQPEKFTKDWRCDIHCRWSPDGDMIGFNSTHTGSRQVYLFKLSEHEDR